jgi:protein arginine N-methyltransferase 5
MISPKIEASQFERNVVEEEVSDDTWHWWNSFRCIANFEKKLSLALELTADLPETEDIDRWLGEQIKCLVVPNHLFMTNKKGFPVLPKPHQVVIRQFLRQKAQILITGAQRHQHYKHYQQYIEHLWQVRGNVPTIYFRPNHYVTLSSRLVMNPILSCNLLKDTKIFSNFLSNL